MHADPAPITDTAALAADFAELVTRGCEALNAGDLEQARASFEEAVARYPGEAVGHNNLGAFYLGLGDTAAAIGCFQRVAELLPERTNSHFNLGMALFQAGSYLEAATVFATAAALNPEDPEAANNIGAARFMAGDLGSARTHFIKALGLQPNYPNAVLNLCDVEVAEGRVDAARELCEAYLEHHRDLAVSRRLLELLEVEARAAVEEAIPHAEALVAADAEDRLTRRHLGRLLEARRALTAEG